MLSLTPAKPIKVADIYLSKEQINSQTPGNLLHVFFTNVRPPKKVLEDQLTQVLLCQLFSASSGVTWRHWVMIHFLSWKILRKYGVPKPKFDKSKYNKAGKEQHPVKVVSTKRPVTKPPTKEKSMLNSVRWVCSALWHLGNVGFHCRNPGFYPTSLCASLDWIGNAAVALMLERLRFLGIIWQSVSFSRSGVELLRSIYRALELCSSVFCPSALIPKNRSGWTGLGATMAGVGLDGL